MLAEFRADPQKAREERYEAFNGSTGILCLTARPRNLLMWAHYADSHRGFVIGFDTHSTWLDAALRAPCGYGHLGPVQYRATRPSASLLSELTLIDVLLTKGCPWKYEHEWRMILRLREADYAVINAGGAHLFHFPESSVATVILGCRMWPLHRVRLLSVLTGNPAYKDVRVFQAAINNDRYRVGLVDLGRARSLMSAA